MRKSELKKLRKTLTKEEYKSLKPAIALLRKGRDYFPNEEKIIIDPLFNYSKKLKLAYNYSHYLTSAFNSKITKQEALVKFRTWISDVSSSELNCFNTFMGTLKKYMNEISNYFTQRSSSGFVEGFNNRIKVLTRRCYGLKKATSLFQRIKLDTEGFEMFIFTGA